MCDYHSFVFSSTFSAFFLLPVVQYPNLIFYCPVYAWFVTAVLVLYFPMLHSRRWLLNSAVGRKVVRISGALRMLDKLSYTEMGRRTHLFRSPRRVCCCVNYATGRPRHLTCLKCTWYAFFLVRRYVCSSVFCVYVCTAFLYSTLFFQRVAVRQPARGFCSREGNLLDRKSGPALKRAAGAESTRTASFTPRGEIRWDKTAISTDRTRVQRPVRVSSWTAPLFGRRQSPTAG